ncbi:DUF2793 domain-containing protein, partial [Brevundimonas sp. FT23028]|uniref:DUF2793 domain-containing protein n=1 Tax=Brevundimonas sp. FT23028 TaxID=3393748 RepID=UPI003B589FEB
MSDEQSARLGMPYLAAGQMQKHVTLNEALTRLDALVQTAVVSRTSVCPDGAPEDGRLHIVPEDAAEGGWAGLAAGDLVRAEGGAWSRVPAPEGLLVWVVDEAEFVVRQGEVWSRLGARLNDVGPLGRLGVGAVADDQNPFAARLDKALWTAAEAGDLRMTFNKTGPDHVLSLLFQSGFGGKAELGLIGNDDLTLKVSADGLTWRDAMTVDRTTARALFPQGSLRRETIRFGANGSWTPPDWARAVEAVAVGAGGGGGAGAFGPSGPRFG